MKKVLAALAATSVAVAANAGSLNLDMRYDFNNKSYNKNANTTGDSNFVMQTGRLDYKGKVSDKLSYRARLRFTDTTTNETGADSLGTHVDYAYIANKIGENTTLTIGKFNSDIGAFEGMTSGADLYMKSATYGGFNIENPDELSYSKYIYTSGAKLTQKMGDHEVSLMGFNPLNDDQAAKNSRFGAGLTAKGSFMEKALSYAASYHTVALKDKDAKKDFMAVGVVYNAEAVKLGLDYAANTETDASKDKHTTSSVIGTVAYTALEGLTPAVKVASNTFKPDSGSKTTSTGVSAVLEYTPVKEEPFRYHVAYNTVSEKIENGNTKTMNEMVAGIRINADILK